MASSPAWPDPDQQSISKKLDLVLDNLAQQNSLIQHLRNNFTSLKTDITALQEQVATYNKKAGARGSGRIVNEVSVSSVIYS